MLEDGVQQDDAFSHARGAGDLGGLARRPPPLIECLALAAGRGRDERGQVAGAPHRGAPAPAAAAAWRRLSGPSSGRSARPPKAVRVPPPPGAGFELLHAFSQRRRLRAQGFELGFAGFPLPFHAAHAAGGLATQGRQAEAFGLLPLGPEDFHYLPPAADQFGQRLFRGGAEGRIEVIGLGPLAGGAGEVPDPSGIQDADGHTRFMPRRDDRPFVTAGGFTDDVNAGLSDQEFPPPAMAGGGGGRSWI